MEQGVSCFRMPTSHAFHSAIMDPIVEPFTTHVNTIHLKPPQIPYVSNVTGTWITPAEATSPSYWARHLRQTVRFAEGLSDLLQDPERVLLEVGPGHTLSTFARQHPDKAPGQVVLSSLRHPQDQQSDMAFLLNTLGQLWLAGLQVDWFRFYAHERRHRIPLPTYPFERQRYWIEPQKQRIRGECPSDITPKRPGHCKLVLHSFLAILPSAVRSKAWEILVDQESCWLVFIDACGLGSQIVNRLEQAHQHVIAVMVGNQFGRVHDGVYTLNPRQRDDYDALVKELLALDKTPRRILHLWNVTPNESYPSRSC